MHAGDIIWNRSVYISTELDNHNREHVEIDVQVQ
jgi:hypothetical protein